MTAVGVSRVAENLFPCTSWEDSGVMPRWDLDTLDFQITDWTVTNHQEFPPAHQCCKVNTAQHFGSSKRQVS